MSSVLHVIVLIVSSRSDDFNLTTRNSWFSICLVNSNPPSRKLDRSHTLWNRHHELGNIHFSNCNWSFFLLRRFVFAFSSNDKTTTELDKYVCNTNDLQLSSTRVYSQFFGRSVFHIFKVSALYLFVLFVFVLCKFL